MFSQNVMFYCFIDLEIKKGGKPLKIMSARTVARKIGTQFSNNMNNIRKNLKSVEFICTTADVWTSNSRRFIGMTAHWVRLFRLCYLL